YSCCNGAGDGSAPARGRGAICNRVFLRAPSELLPSRVCAPTPKTTCPDTRRLKRWRGSGIRLGSDGSPILAAHQAQMSRCECRRLRNRALLVSHRFDEVAGKSPLPTLR